MAPSVGAILGATTHFLTTGEAVLVPSNASTLPTAEGIADTALWKSVLSPYLQMILRMWYKSDNIKTEESRTQDFVYSMVPV